MSEHKHKTLHNLRIRLHALVVLLIVGWAGYAAVALLVRSVFSPTLLPEEFKGEILPMDAESLRRDNPIQDVYTLRAPMEHYHGVDRWYQPDPYNGCTISGCHSPLPHNKIAAVRSFDNFHATFLACQLCHEYTPVSKTQPQWVHLASGETQEPPAILKLMLYLENNQQEIVNDPAQAHPTIVSLLTETLDLIDGDPLLDYILAHLNTSEPGSPDWKHVTRELAIEIPQHVRGEYGAKLAPTQFEVPNSDYKEQSEVLHSLAQQYFLASDDETRQQTIYDKIHGSLLEKPQKCMVCHNKMAPILDYENLGYSPSRTEFLKGLSIASQMQKIQQGQQFRIKTTQGSIR